MNMKSKRLGRTGHVAHMETSKNTYIVSIVRPQRERERERERER